MPKYYTAFQRRREIFNKVLRDVVAYQALDGIYTNCVRNVQLYRFWLILVTFSLLVIGKNYLNIQVIRCNFVFYSDFHC